MTTRILGTNSEDRSFALDAELNWHLEMDNEAVHTGISPSMIKQCMLYEYERGATGGKLHIRMDDKFAFIMVDFTIEDVAD